MPKAERCKYPNFIRTLYLICAPRESWRSVSYTLVDAFSFIKQIGWPLFCRIARVAIVRFLGLNRTNSKMNQSNSPFGTETISNWKRKRNMWRMNWRWNLGGMQHQQWQIWMHRSQKWRAGHHQQCIEIVLYRLFYTTLQLPLRYDTPWQWTAQQQFEDRVAWKIALQWSLRSSDLPSNWSINLFRRFSSIIPIVIIIATSTPNNSFHQQCL